MVAVIDIPITEGFLLGVIEVLKEEELLQDTEGEEAGHVAHLYHAALAIVTVVIAAALFAVVPQLMCPSHVCLHELIGEGRRLVAGAHQNQYPLWTPSLPSDSVKTDQGRHLEALVGRRAWFRMMMALLIPAKVEMGEDEVLRPDKLEHSILHVEKLCFMMKSVLASFLPPLPTGPGSFGFLIGAALVVSLHSLSVV